MANVIRQQTVLQASQVRGAATTPQNLVAPQTPGGLIVPVQVIGIPKFTADFTGSVVGTLRLGAWDMNTLANIQNSLNANHVIDFLGGNGTSGIYGEEWANLIEQPLRFVLDTDLTGGTGSMLVVTFFTVIYPSY